METKWLKFWKGLAVLLLALNIALMCFLIFRPPFGGPPMKGQGGPPGKFLVEKLKFSEQQKTAFESLREAHHDSILILMDEGMKLRKTFFDGLKIDAGNTMKDSLANLIANNQKQIELLTYSHFEKVKMLCDPSQKLIFNDIIQEVIHRMGQANRERPR